MDEAHDALLVDQSLGGHTAEFEDLDLLAVALEHDVFGIGQAGEGQVVLAEIIGELLGVFRTDDENGRVAFAKLFINLAQLRHVRAAERSLETTVENQQNVLLTLVVGERNRMTLVILQHEIGCRGVDRDFGHILLFFCPNFFFQARAYIISKSIFLLSGFSFCEKFPCCFKRRCA